MKESLRTMTVPVVCVVKLTASRLCSVQSSSTGLSPGSAGGSIWCCGSSCFNLFKLFHPNWRRVQPNAAAVIQACGDTLTSEDRGLSSQDKRSGPGLFWLETADKLQSAAGTAAHAQSSCSPSAADVETNKRRSCGVREAWWWWWHQCCVRHARALKWVACLFSCAVVWRFFYKPSRVISAEIWCSCRKCCYNNHNI